MTKFTYLFAALLVVTALSRSWGEMADTDAKAISAAEKVVEQMRGLSMQSRPPRSDGKPDPIEDRRRMIMDELRALGEKAVPALVRTLSDPDVQMRRNSELVLIQLASPIEKKPRVNIKEALPGAHQSDGRQ